jgi:hypothetical protein
MMLKLKPTIGRRRLTLQAVALVQALLVMFAGTEVRRKATVCRTFRYKVCPDSVSN